VLIFVTGAVYTDTNLTSRTFTLVDSCSVRNFEVYYL